MMQIQTHKRDSASCDLHSPPGNRKATRHVEEEDARSGANAFVVSARYNLQDPKSKVFDFLVLGGGTSAGYMAKAFVAHGVTNGSVCIVSREAVPPYERHHLSKGYLFKWKGFEDMLACTGMGSDAQSTMWYVSNGINLVLNCEVSKVDCKNRAIFGDNGITYFAREALTIATGSKPRRIKMTNEGQAVRKLRNVFTLTTKSDADEIVTTLAPLRVSKKKPKCLVLGSGFLGMEVAASMQQMGMETIIISRPKQLNQGIFSENIATYYDSVFRKNGVEIAYGNPVKEIVGQGGILHHVILQDGTELEADCALVCIGNVPSSDIVKGQLAMRGAAVKVDGSLESSVPGVFAVGDLCQLPLGMYGNSTSGGNPLMHGEHARRSGCHVVKSLLKREPEHKRVYEYHPYLYSSFFDCQWKFWGDTVGAEVQIGRPGEGTFMVLWMWENRIQGLFVESLPRSSQIMMEAASRIQCKVPQAELEKCETVDQAVELISACVDLTSIHGVDEFGDAL